MSMFATVVKKVSDKASEIASDLQFTVKLSWEEIGIYAFCVLAAIIVIAVIVKIARGR